MIHNGISLACLDVGLGLVVIQGQLELGLEHLLLPEEAVMLALHSAHLGMQLLLRRKGKVPQE